MPWLIMRSKCLFSIRTGFDKAATTPEKQATSAMGLRPSSANAAAQVAEVGATAARQPV